MTDEYRERIIKWLTGNYEIETSSTDPLFQDIEETTTEINTYFSNVQGYIQGRDGKGNELDIGFIYGINNNSKGIIVIVDKNFNIIQVIDEYDSGTKFYMFQCLNIDKTNGNIYGIDYSSNKYRFILLNNFLLKTPAQTNYEVKLRNSYFLEFTSSVFVPVFVEKRPSDSFYVITGISANNRPTVATYKIEVGSTNELIEYRYTGDNTEYNLKSYNIAWSGEEFIEKIGCYVSPQNQYDFLEVSYVEFIFNGTTITKNKTIELEETYLTQNLLEDTLNIAMNNADTYICYPIHWSSYDDAEATVILKIDYDNDGYTEIERVETDETLEYRYSAGTIIKINNQFYFYIYKNTDDPTDNTQAKFSITYGAILNDSSLYITEKTYDNLQVYDLLLYTKIFTVSTFYNLITYRLIGSNSNKLLIVEQILNSLNYNYADYQDINSMVPTSAWLYDENDKIIYARNLYNKVVNGNTTTSTLEIPNLLLNDIDITKQSLLGGTNGILVNNNETITKNVYENLYINFYNTLTMQNRNTALFIPNLVGASRLNNSISNVIDYSDAKIGKVRVNYSDDTSLVKAINPATRISQFVYQFSFNVYVPGTKNITSIELISADEGTTYQTITGLNLENSKSYKITQNVEIGE